MNFLAGKRIYPPNLAAPMLRQLIPALLFSALALTSPAEVDLDLEAFGESLGGWKKDGTTVDYALSGSNYRTYRPEITPTPDGGIFVSVRIDHLRGWLANNDHAVLEITFGSDGSVLSAQSSLAIQGKTITSDLIRSGATAGNAVPGAGGAVKVGTDLVADLSSKLLREKIVEAGRVSYPAALRHNYNLLFQAVRSHTEQPAPKGTDPAESPPPEKTPEKRPPGTPSKLEIKPFAPR